MFYYIYFLKDVETDELIRIYTETFLGDLNDNTRIAGKRYIISDYVEEFLDVEIPEDF